MTSRARTRRVTEKSFLNANGISTAGFRTVDNDGDLAAALEAFGGSGVLKTRRFGYDGKGQRVIRESGMNFTVANGMKDAAEKVVSLAA